MRTDASDVAGGDTPGRDAPMNRAGIDENLVVDGLIFATPGDRCRYLGTSNREKPRWLEQNKGRYRRLDNVLQESTQLVRPDNVEATPTAPNCGTSSRDIRKDGGDDDNSSLVGTLPEHRSPAHQLTSLPAPAVNEDVLSGSTQTEVQPRAKAAATETIGPKSETNPPAATGRNRDRSGSRQLGEQEQPARISKSTRKLSPELMRIVLDTLREYPVQSYAARMAGIHPKTLAYWLKRSNAGDDGYDIEWQDVTSRFHEHYESAIEEAHDKLRDIMFQRALGYDKVLTHRGRVSYKIDQGLVGLGYEGPDAYLKDDNGNLVPETIRKVDPNAIRFLMKSLHPKYGNNPKIDTPHKGGVLVIGETKKPEYDTAASVKARQWKAESRRIREEKDWFPGEFSNGRLGLRRR
jgi:hypothetical protein